MNKVAIIVLADTETHGDLGRAFNALQAVKEFKEAGDDVRLIFDGAGTKWIVEFSNPDHKAHDLFEAVKDKIAGACYYCSKAFGVKAGVENCGIPFTSESEGHPSFRKLIQEGFQIITF